MIPDKIYCGNNGHGNISFSSSSFDSASEYIRKDALMEWLQQGFDWVKNPVISVQQIIDKLNSM